MPIGSQPQVVTSWYPFCRRVAPVLAATAGFGLAACRDAGWRAVVRSFVACAPASWPPRCPGPPCARSARRALATVAEVLALPHEDRLPLGSWVDPFVEHRTSGSTMPARYVADETKLWSQFQSKATVCDAVGRAIADLNVRDVAGCAWDGFVASSIRDKFRAKIHSALPRVACQEHGHKGGAPDCPSTVRCSASSSSSRSSSRSSSSSSRAEPAVCMAQHITEYAELFWILYQKTPQHACLHRCVVECQKGSSIQRPACCFTQREGDVGYGLLDAAAVADSVQAQWCSRYAPDVRAFCKDSGAFPLWA